jgi:hypothetical protein
LTDEKKRQNRKIEEEAERDSREERCVGRCELSMRMAPS